MDRNFMQTVFSMERMQKYWDRHDTYDQKAIAHYKANVEVSESFYSTLSVFEVAYRNSLNRELTIKYATQDWHNHIVNEVGLKDLHREIKEAQRHIVNRNEIVTGSKVVAELTLGFWVRLLNAEYERILWKDLRRAFPYMPKKDRQRHKVSSPINKIRNFRNRIFHHEPILWDLNAVNQIHSDIHKVCGWINNDLPNFVSTFDRFPEVLNRVIL
jgi:hypothetical protein